MLKTKIIYKLTAQDYITPFLQFLVSLNSYRID